MLVTVLYFIQVALGSVTNVEEAVKWLSYTYFYVRMRANPLAYGINHKVYQVGDQSLMIFFIVPFRILVSEQGPR